MGLAFVLHLKGLEQEILTTPQKGFNLDHTKVSLDIWMIGNDSKPYELHHSDLHFQTSFALLMTVTLLSVNQSFKIALKIPNALINGKRSAVGFINSFT